MSYCTLEDTSALLTYIDGEGVTEKITFKNACPIDVTVSDIDKETFRFDGGRPLNHFAPGEIVGVSCTGTFRQIGNNPATELPCTYILSTAVITGNRLQSEFDSTYSDNTGDMTFKVDYKSTQNIIRVFSNSELIYKDVRPAPITFKVQCIRVRCPEGYCECKTDTYPGYCCNDCEKTASELRGLTKQVRLHNG
ncbi:hypothetical protein [Nostoc sp. TCL240-02]|uniref:hypothetical protein n=1 Tax=Nostoc sp. TCL240-02 TaxID=2572090 RepID=UPI00157FBD82|nr:hypothetical protein [Nostoc sp. TCL240-02]QKQ76344.1 hypothetical protein FBB35_26405 [Nostoc sp. TCL240-02]